MTMHPKPLDAEQVKALREAFADAYEPPSWWSRLKAWFDAHRELRALQVACTVLSETIERERSMRAQENLEWSNKLASVELTNVALKAPGSVHASMEQIARLQNHIVDLNKKARRSGPKVTAKGAVRPDR